MFMITENFLVDFSIKTLHKIGDDLTHMKYKIFIIFFYLDSAAFIPYSSTS
jgi:hypothetical protein